MSFNTSSKSYILKKTSHIQYVFTIIKFYECNHCIVPFIVPLDI